MDSLEIADFSLRHKIESYTPPTEIDPLAGLLAMQRWGRISIEQYAISRGLSTQQAIANLKRFEEQKLVESVRLTVRRETKNGMKLYGLTNRGFALLQEDYPHLEVRKKPQKQVVYSTIFEHKYNTICAILSAQFNLQKYCVYLDNHFADFERKSRFSSTSPTALPVTGKKLIPDAILDIGDDDGNEARYFVEVDRGTEPVMPYKAGTENRSIYSMVKEYSEYFLKNYSEKTRRVLFITTSEKQFRDVMVRIPWDKLSASDYFRIAHYDDAVGRAASGEKRIRGNFWGPIWQTPKQGQFVPLLKDPS